MKNNFLKKIASVTMSLAVALSFMVIPTSTYAAQLDNKLTVKNVEADATVVGYKIVKEEDGAWVKGDSSLNIQDVKKPTAQEVQAIAGNSTLLNKLTKIEFAKSGSEYIKNNPEAGTYLVIVTPKAGSTNVYTPMIVSADYTQDVGTDKSSNVDANSKYFSTAYAKKTTPSVDKKIENKVNNPSVTNDGTKKGDTHNVGDEVEFKITTSIPVYSKDYDNNKLKFEITDKVSEGLDLQVGTIKVQNNGVDLPATNYTIDPKTGKTFKIAFNKDFLLNGAAKAITVVYKAKINAQAKSGFDANTNEAKIDYSTSPSTNDGSDKKVTHHYTFDINGNVSAKYTDKVREIVKVGIDEGTGELITKEVDKSKTEKIKKAEAKFKLFKKVAGFTKGEEYINSNKEIGGEQTTDADGLMHFKGLDAGEYVVVETKAPTGYAKNTTPVPVNITAKLTDEGLLESYSVSINGVATTTYKANYEGATDKIKTIDKTGDSGLFNNYKLGNLPSTGGIGTYIFYAIGAALVAFAAAMLIRNRRQNANK